MTRRRRAKKRKRARGVTTPRGSQKWPDKRAIFAGVTAVGGKPVSEETMLVVIEPIRLSSGEALYFQAPFVVPFYLFKAKELRDRAEPKRQATLERTAPTADGTLRPRDPARAFDAIEDLSLVVILAAAAIEAYANDAIDRLPDDAMIEIPTRLGGETIMIMRNKSAMDRLGLGEKLTRAVPLLTGRPSIKGTNPWQAYRRVSRLRNRIVHYKRATYNAPDEPSPFGRLLLGEGSRAPEDAALVIEALEPGWLPEHVRGPLGL